MPIQEFGPGQHAEAHRATLLAQAHLAFEVGLLEASHTFSPLAHPSPLLRGHDRLSAASLALPDCPPVRADQIASCEAEELPAGIQRD